MIKLLLPILLLTGGCLHVSHETRLPDGTVDKSSGNAFLFKGSLDGLNTTSAGKQGTNSYNHTLKVKSAQGETEIEKLAPLIGAAAEGAAKGATRP